MCVEEVIPIRAQDVIVNTLDACKRTRSGYAKHETSRECFSWREEFGQAR